MQTVHPLLILIISASICAPAASAEPDPNPDLSRYSDWPAAVRQDPWDMNDPADLSGLQNVRGSAFQDGILHFTSDTPDPAFYLNLSDKTIDARYNFLAVRMSASRPGSGQLFYWSPNGDWNGFLFFGIQQGWHTYYLDLQNPIPIEGQGSDARRTWGSSLGQISRLRIDPVSEAGVEIQLDWVKLLADVDPSVRDECIPLYNEPLDSGRRTAAPRIDVAREKPGPVQPLDTGWTIAAWYFAAWEPEYDWDGWEKMALRCPWRQPLLYDSADSASRHHGIQYYANGNPAILDWHIKWMRESGINLMLWDWYPVLNQDGSFHHDVFQNRALEIGFLGKQKLDDPPVPTNRFADLMPFAVMWTNHAPFDNLSLNIFDYMIDNFLRQPNYYRLDGRPLVIFWAGTDFTRALGSEEKAKDFIAAMRQRAQQASLPDPYFVTCNVLSPHDIETVKRLGFDSVVSYNFFGLGGKTIKAGRSAGSHWIVQEEDFPSQTIPSHESVWQTLSDSLGQDFLLPLMPMQDWRPIDTREFRPYLSSATPENFRLLLQKAKQFIRDRRHRPFLTIEAWNEWYEGSYIEPSLEYGYDWLTALRAEFTP